MLNSLIPFYGRWYLLQWKVWSIPLSQIPLHFDGIGPKPCSLKLFDSGQTPSVNAVGAKEMMRVWSK